MPDTMLASSLHFKMRLLQLDGPQTNVSAIPGGVHTLPVVGSGYSGCLLTYYYSEFSFAARVPDFESVP